MGSPLVSVLLPVFQAEASILSCLESIRRQTLRHWECVLVDDGSTDRTAERARELAGGDPRFRIVRRPHAGLVSTLNAGIELCRGVFLARMDADDLMHRLRLEQQVAALEADPDLSGVGCHVRLFPRSGLGPGYRSYERWLNSIDSAPSLERELFVECPVAHPSLMLRGTVARELRYRDRGWPEDYDLVLRLVTSGRKVGVLPQRRLSWRHHPGRLSRVAEPYRLARFTACKADFLAGTLLRGREQYLLWGYGATGRALARALSALGKRASHIIELHPGRLGNRIHGASVVPPEALPALPRRPLVVSVAGEIARRRIRAALSDLGFVELVDFVCAA